MAKAGLKDYKSAIVDYDKAIVLDPGYTKAYGNRGVAKVKLQQYKAGLLDYNKAISLDPAYTIAYINRGNLKHNYLNDFHGACIDWKKAKELGDSRVDDIIKENCK